MAASSAAPGLADDGRSDPSANVFDLVRAETRRQDDIRDVVTDAIRREAALRAEYEDKLRRAETARIDAIRAVDVGAVNRAAEVSAQQATTLAAQVATSAETLRTQVAAAATASTVALAAALEPIMKDVADLRRVQYEQVGGKAQVVEARDTRSDMSPVLEAIASLNKSRDTSQGSAKGIQQVWGVLIGGVGLLATLIAIVYALSGRG